MVCGMWYVAYGMWYAVCDVWYVAYGMWYAVCDVWYTVCGMWYTRYVECGTPLRFAVGGCGMCNVVSFVKASLLVVSFVFLVRAERRNHPIYVFFFVCLFCVWMLPPPPPPPSLPYRQDGRVAMTMALTVSLVRRFIAFLSCLCLFFLPGLAKMLLSYSSLLCFSLGSCFLFSFFPFFRSKLPSLSFLHFALCVLYFVSPIVWMDACCNLHLYGWTWTRVRSHLTHHNANAKGGGGDRQGMDIFTQRGGVQVRAGQFYLHFCR